jgi:multidrug efflux pump subunit AcrB
LLWVVAILFSPLTGTWLLPAHVKHHGGSAGRLSQAYRALLDRVLRYRLRTIGIALLTLILSGVGATYMQGNFSRHRIGPNCW